MMSHDVYFKRRQRVLQAMAEGIAIVHAAPEQRRSNDTFYPYRQDSYFYYLTGFNEPGASLILNALDQTALLFCRDKHPEQEIWEGFRYGPEAAADAFGFEYAYSSDDFDSVAHACISNSPTLYALWGLYPEQDRVLMNLWQSVKEQAWHNVRAPKALMDLGVILDNMRLIKDTHELTQLKQAAKISALGHLAAMRAAKPGLYEYQLEAELLHTFVQHGARSPAYESIVASGKNACVLHYVNNNAQLQDGELVMIDAGAEFGSYAGDISRTFPVNGRFNDAQRDVYEIVLAAQLAAIKSIKAKVSWQTVSDAALNILVQGLIDLKLLQGSVASNIEQQTYRRFYMHGLGHWVGLDVHDVGGRHRGGKPILLKEGMCTTVEPGLYIPGDADIPEAFRNMGIRIEDNVLVTDSGCVVYTADVPKNISDIEDVMHG
ncbi:aminopeptidase P N-terminal domain-containing protein [Neisseriaceae bacterium CLB008]|nr:aminopeptidase P N-terminal domain-containing protein [Neisseriaceae bacterium]